MDFKFVTLPAGKTPGFKVASNTVYEAPAAGTIFTSPLIFGGVSNVYISGLKGPNAYGISFSLAEAVDAFDDNGGNNNNIFACGLEFNSTVDNCIMRRAADRATWNGDPSSALWNGLYFQHIRIEGAFTIFTGTWHDQKDYVIGLTMNDVFWGNNVGQNPVLLEAHNVFAATFMNWTVRNQAKPLGDCGTIWIEVGNAKFDNWDWEGTWGYIFRLGGIKLPPIAMTGGGFWDQESRAYNCKKVKSTHYGLGSYRVDDFTNNRTHIGKNGMTAGGFSYINCTVADTVGDKGYYSGLAVIGDCRNEAGVPQTINIQNCYAANTFDENKNQWNPGNSLVEDDSAGNAKIVITNSTGHPVETAIPSTDLLGADYYPRVGSPLVSSNQGARGFLPQALPSLPQPPITGGGTNIPPVTTPPPAAETVTSTKVVNVKTVTTYDVLITYSSGRTETKPGQ
jgi:hypothetical protein